MSHPKLTQLPVVAFEYPDSETLLLKTRFVRILQMNTKHVEGYELQPGGEFKFKRYNVRRIPQNGVALLSFNTK